MRNIVASHLVLALAVLVHAFAPASAQEISDGKVRIGVITDMSGPYADLGGKGSVLAAEMAVKDFGGTVRGKPVEIVFSDHQNKPDIASARVREWFDRDGVDMVTDVLSSPVGLTVAKIAAEKRRLVINTGSATTRLTNEDCNQYSVSYVYDTFMLANGNAKALLAQGQKDWFFLTVDNAFGQSLEKDSSEVLLAAGGSVKGSVRHPLNTSDFSSFLLQAQSSGAQVLVIANAGADTLNALRTASEFGLTKKMKVAALMALIGEVDALGPKIARGMFVTEGWYWDTNDETRAFGKRYFAQMNRMPNMSHAGIYSAVTTYLKAIDATGTDDADKVIAWLRSHRINDMFAKDGFIREDGRMVHDVYLMQAKKPDEVAYPWDYMKILSVLKGEDAFQSLSKSRCALVKK